MNAIVANTEGFSRMPRLKLDGWLMVWVLLLIAGGLAALYSASGGSGEVMLFQASRLVIGLGIMLVLAQVTPRALAVVAPWVYGATVLLLGVVLLAGEQGGGAQRWLDLGIRFQPSEFTKLALPLVVASLLRAAPETPGPGRTMAVMAIIAAPVLLVAAQPDLGTAVVVFFYGMATLFLAGLHRRFIYGGAVAGFLAVPVLWSSLHAYQRARILNMFNPEADPLGAGYHAIQSKIAIGSGGGFGKGWMQSSQAQFGFLPEPTTDFVFSVISEELGFAGAVVAMLLFIAITVRMLQIALAARGRFSRLLATTLAIGFFFSFLLNAAMTTGLLPVVGLPLPLVSVAGSANVTFLASLGILMAIQNDQRYLAR